MKLFILILALFGWNQIHAQDSLENSYTAIAGRWDVIYDVNEASLSEELLNKTKETRVTKGGNHNIAVLHFDKDGTFRMMSIQDYGAGDEQGLFELKRQGKLLTFHVLMPNSLDREKRYHVQKKKSSVLVSEEDVMVIQFKKHVFYLKRTE